MIADTARPAVDWIKARLRNPAFKPLRKVYDTALELSRVHTLFASPRDLLKYYRVKDQPQTLDGPVELYVNELSAPLQCRPRTTDALVLVDTFRWRYHLPPKPLRSNAVIVDLGGNVGYTAAHFGSLYPDARIYAVEMDALNFETAQRNTRSLGSRCTWEHAAIWSFDGEVTYGGTDEWAFQVDAEPSAVNKPGTRKVAAISMNSLFKKHGLTEVDYVKMDIEGAEGRVLEKDVEWMRGVKTIKVEAHPPTATIEQVRAALEKNGFKCHIDDAHWALVVGLRA